MQIYNAIIVSQLTYGLNTVRLTPGMLKRLDAFQMRGLRYILGIDHAYFSGVSNEEVYGKANIVLNRGEDVNISWEEFIAANNYGSPKEIVKLSDYVMKRHTSLLGHLIRADQADLMKVADLTEMHCSVT